MKQFRYHVIRAGLGALYFTGAHYLLRPMFAGVGSILMLHNVRPPRDATFNPTVILKLRPEFLRRNADAIFVRTISISSPWMRCIGG
ncbi:MAG: hypothetical protein WDN50_04570 [Bradyrhizobium sp.]